MTAHDVEIRIFRAVIDRPYSSRFGVESIRSRRTVLLASSLLAGPKLEIASPRDQLQSNSYSTCRVLVRLRLRGRLRRQPKQVHHQETMRYRPFLPEACPRSRMFPPSVR